MRITHEITLDFAVRGQTPVIPAVQGDENTRAVCIRLTDGGSEWPVPEDASVMIRYRRPDGTGGIYDTLADGSVAWSASGSTVTVILAPELLVLPGLTVVSAAITREEEVLGTFSFHVAITEDPSAGLTEADTYCYLGYSLTQLKAYVDERVAGVQCPLTVETVAAETADSSPSVAVTGLTLSQSALSLTVGNTVQLGCVVSPSNASNTAVIWKTGSAGVATVSGGKVTAVAAGTCTITAVSAADAAISASCAVTVTADSESSEPETVPVTGLALDQSTLSLAEGGSGQLTYTVTPSDATNPAITWETSDATVAVVEYGLVTAVAVGECTITVRSAENTSITAACAVTVTAVSNTVTVPLLSLDTLVTGKLRKPGGTETSISSGAYVSFPYIEGMFVSVYMNVNWVSGGHPAFLVKAPDGTETSVTADDVTSYVHTVTLSGYEAGSTVYVNINNNGGAKDSNSYYAYDTEV